MPYFYYFTIWNSSAINVPKTFILFTYEKTLHLICMVTSKDTKHTKDIWDTKLPPLPLSVLIPHFTSVFTHLPKTINFMLSIHLQPFLLKQMPTDGYTLRMSSLASSLGAGNSILRSIRPGRRRAGSKMSIRLVAMITCKQVTKAMTIKLQFPLSLRSLSTVITITLLIYFLLFSMHNIIILYIITIIISPMFTLIISGFLL